MEKSVPILIGGGSLAGIACAIRLRQLGHTAWVLEKSHFPRPKLCGEFLGPDALTALKRLNLLEVVQELAFGPVRETLFFNRKGRPIRIKHAWISREYPYGLAIPRETLDHVLVEQAKKMGIPVLEGRCILSPIQMKNSRFEITANTKSASRQIQPERWITHCFIDATGRSGKLSLRSHASQSVAKTNPLQKWIGIQCHVELPEFPLGSTLGMFLFAEGYGGIQPISAHQANVCMMVHSSLGKKIHQNFNDFIATTIGQNPAAAEFLRNAQQIGSFCTTADINLSIPGKSGQENKPNELIRVGDASVTVDPFTGSGMAHALETALLAAETLHEGIQRNMNYQTLCRQYQVHYRRQFQTRLKFMQWFRPLLEYERLQQAIWPILPPFLPWLASTFR
jgi:menaquinone-9 beta-reductase